MGERPLIFSAPMVRALLDGRKTQTRRVFKPQPELLDGGKECRVCGHQGSTDYLMREIAPRFWGPTRIGDRLWVREVIERANDEAVGYPANGAWLPNTPWAWKRSKLPSIHMPRWASRLTLIVSDVRVQRLQDISEADAIAEGSREPSLRDLGGELAHAAMTERQVFVRLWRHLHGAGAWDANPWVAALTFTVERRNIDALAATREAAHA